MKSKPATRYPSTFKLRPFNRLVAGYRSSRLGFSLSLEKREFYLFYYLNGSLLSLGTNLPVRFTDRVVGPSPFRFKWGKWRPSYPPRRRLPRFKFSISSSPLLFISTFGSPDLRGARFSYYLSLRLTSIQFYERLRSFSFLTSGSRSPLSSLNFKPTLPLLKRRRGGCFVRLRGLRFFLPNRRIFLFPTRRSEPKAIFNRNRRGNPLFSALLRSVRFLSLLDSPLRTGSYVPLLVYLFLRLQSRFLSSFNTRLSQLRWYRFFKLFLPLFSHSSPLDRFNPTGTLFSSPPSPLSWKERKYGLIPSILTPFYKKRLLSRPRLLRRFIRQSAVSAVLLNYYSLPTRFNRFLLPSPPPLLYFKPPFFKKLSLNRFRSDPPSFRWILPPFLFNRFSLRVRSRSVFRVRQPFLAQFWSKPEPRRRFIKKRNRTNATA